MDERLQGIDLKLDRAEKHLEDIQTDFSAWISEEKTRDFPTEIDEGKGRYIVALRLMEPVPPVFALMADEVIHHLRSSLDHLASYLVDWSGGQEGRAAWPLLSSRCKWMREVERRKRIGQVWRKKGGGPLAGASAEVRAFVEGKQPYKGPGKARDHPLVSLNKLWNIEKHRILNPIPVYAAPPASWRSLFKVEGDVEPVEFAWLLRPNDELKLGTPTLLARLHFPPVPDLPKVKMDGKIPVEIAVGDGKGERTSLNEDLILIRQIVAEARNLFPPRS